MSVLVVGDGVCEVLPTNGDTHLGGDDFDKVILEWLADHFKKTEGIALLKDRQGLLRNTEAAEKATIKLSGVQEANVPLPLIIAEATHPRHMDANLSLDDA